MVSFMYIVILHSKYHCKSKHMDLAILSRLLVSSDCPGAYLTLISNKIKFYSLYYSALAFKRQDSTAAHTNSGYCAGALILCTDIDCD